MLLRSQSPKLLLPEMLKSEWAQILYLKSGDNDKADFIYNDININQGRTTEFVSNHLFIIKLEEKLIFVGMYRSVQSVLKTLTITFICRNVPCRNVQKCLKCT